VARKRDVIIKATLAAFLRDGYAGSSMNRIAEEAGVSIKAYTSTPLRRGKIGRSGRDGGGGVRS
jgi:Bacterial regulatory proteins, tetR family